MGDDVGLVVGDDVGLAVGAEVGLAVGDDVGLAVGGDVGLATGDMVQCPQNFAHIVWHTFLLVHCFLEPHRFPHHFIFFLSSH